MKSINALCWWIEHTAVSETIQSVAWIVPTVQTIHLVAHTDTISIMLQSFPHLFPPSTNQWKPNDPDRDPATDTSASPELWRNFGDFYQRAQAASKFALDATRAKHGNEFKALIGQLRAGCDGCHAAYLKTE
jgi:hypothetical protein